MCGTLRSSCGPQLSEATGYIHLMGRVSLFLMPRFFAIFTILAVASAQNQFQQQNPDNVIRITVNLVQVDAVVTDSKDKPVTSLKKEDFILLQDGKPQTITNFTYVSLKDASVRTTSTPKPQPKPG